MREHGTDANHNYSMRTTLEQWLEKAREALTFVREHYGPAQEGDVLAEIDFYEKLLAWYATGGVDRDTDDRPPAIFVRTTLDAIDHGIERAQERAASCRERGDEEGARAADEEQNRERQLRRYAETFLGRTPGA
jgi:hypothetical protein